MKKVISFLSSLVFLLFLSVSYCSADGMGSELNNDFSNKSKLNNIKNNNRNKTDNPKSINEDIF